MKPSNSSFLAAVKSQPANYRTTLRSPTPGESTAMEIPTFATVEEMFECLRHPQFQWRAAQELSRYASSDLQDRPVEQREAAFDAMYRTLSTMISNYQNTDARAGGLLALVALLESDYLAIETKWLSRFRYTVRQCMPTGNDQINKLSALVISKLALRSVGTTADLVEFQVKQAFEWLTSGETLEQQKSAIALLRALARNCPLQFHMHISQFFDYIFIVIFSPKLQIREEAIKAFQAVLEVAAQRETKDTTDVYESCFDKILLNLQQHASPRDSSSASSISGYSNPPNPHPHANVPLRDEQIHGALLVLVEMLRISCREFERSIYDAECIVGPESQRQMSLGSHNAVMNTYRRKLQLLSFPLRRSILLQHSNRYGHSSGGGAHGKQQKVEDFAEYWLGSSSAGVSGALGYDDERRFYASAQCRAHIERHYVTLCKVTQQHKLSNDAAILATIANIVPRLATFQPEKFSTNTYWPDAAGFLFNVGRRDLRLMFRTVGFYIAAVKNQILVELGGSCFALVEALKQAIVGSPATASTGDGGGRKSRHKRDAATTANSGEPRTVDTDVLLCIDLMARSIKSEKIDAELKQLVFLLLSQSFTQPVIACIHDIVRHREAIKRDVHEQLQKTLLILLSSRRSPSASTISLNTTSKDQRLNKSTENLIGGGVRSSATSLTQKTSHLFGRRSGAASSQEVSTARRSPSYDHLASSSSGYQLAPVVSSSDILMALKTLGLFNFDNTDLKKFIDEIVDVYLDVDDPRILEEAIRTCSKVLHHTLQHLTRQYGQCQSPNTMDLVQRVLTKLLTIGIIHPSADIRYTVFVTFHEELDIHLAQPEHLSSLFLALNDTQFEIREVVIGLLGRLIDINPAYVKPALRKVIVQVIMEFEQSGVNRYREASGRLLLQLITSAPAMMRSNADPVLQAILGKLDLRNNLHAPTQSDVTVMYCINAVGELAEVTAVIGGQDVRRCAHQLVDVCYNLLQDSSTGQGSQPTSSGGSSSGGGGGTSVLSGGAGSATQLSKREETLRTLGKIIGCVGCVMEPYSWHPLLLDRLLCIVRSDQSRTIRREAMRVLGLLGALDPYRHKVNMGEIDVESDVLATGTSLAIATGVEEDEAPAQRQFVLPPAAGGDAVNRGEDLPNETLISLSSVNMEEYYPAVAVHYLLRILDDPTQISSHTRAVDIIVKIFRSLEAGRFRRYIYQVIPALLKVATYHDSERSFLLSQLSSIIMIVRHHVKPFMPSIVDAVRECWQQHGSVDLIVPTTSASSMQTPAVLMSPSTGAASVGNPRDIDKNIISVIECLVAALGTDFKPFVAELMSCYLKILGSDDPNVEHTQIMLIESFQRYGPILQDYLHMLLPQMSRLANSARTSLMLKSKFLETIDVLSKKLNFTDFASQIIHPVIKILDLTVASGDAAEKDDSVAAAMTTLRDNAMNTLCALVVQLEKRYLLLEPRVALVLGRLGIRNRRYERLVYDLKLNSSLSAAHVAIGVASSLSGNSLPRAPNNQFQRTASLNDGTSDEQQQQQIQQQQLDVRQNAFMEASEMAAFSKITLKVDALRPLWLSVLQRRSALSKEEWTEWMKRFMLAVIHESPSPALRACFTLAQGYQTLARELFNAAFVSCWSELADDDRAKLLEALGDVLAYSDAPTEITQTLLNLAEFMEHCERGPLPLDAKLLASVALRCRAYAKALHYVERDFQQAVQQRSSTSYADSRSVTLSPSSGAAAHSNTSSTDVMEKLITINQKLQQPDAASGVLDYALKQQQQQLQLQGIQRGLPYAAGVAGIGGGGEQHLKESWYERLHEWERALVAYEKRQETTNTAAVLATGSPEDVECMLGRMRCLEALGDWQHLYQLVEEKWPASTEDTQQRMSTIASSAAWALGRWERFHEFSEKISPSTVDAAIADTVYAISVTKNFYDAQSAIDRARDLLDVDISALASESYSRAYSAMVVNQQLAELEEVMQYKLVPEREAAIKEIWWHRLLGSQRTIEDWQRILMVRGLVVQPKADIRPWLKFASMCRKQGRLSTAHHVLTGLMGFNAARLVVPTAASQNMPFPQQPFEQNLPSSSKTLEGAEYYTAYAYLKLLWQSSDKKHEAFAQLKNFVVNAVCPRMVATSIMPSSVLGANAVIGFTGTTSSSSIAASAAAVTLSPQQALINQQAHYNKLLAKCCLKLGSWAESLHGVNEATIGETLQYCLAATQHDPSWNKAWHAWAVMNFEAVLYYKNKLHDTRLEIAAQQQAAVAAGSSTGMSITGGMQQQSGVALRSSSGAAAIPSSNFSNMGPHGDGVVDVNALRQSRSASALGTLQQQQPNIILFPQRVTREQEVANITGFIRHYSVAAVKGFVQSITLAAQSPTNSSTLQDTLRLLSLWFDYGMYPEVYEALVDGIRCIHIDTWLQVIPQLIARIDTPRQLVAKLIHQLLTDIARHHPQALIYPLTVASKSAVAQRRSAANKILTFMCEQNAVLVKQALLVSEELIRVAISWQEMWHESLEDASRLYFGDHNVRGMFAVLEPLHELLESGAQTLKEITFRDVFARELREAHDLCQRYQKTGRVQDLTAAWDLYYHVFRKIAKQLPQITSLELKYVSPKLMACSNLELAVPGTYDPGKPVVRIIKVKPNVQVITSKQRPRKVCMIGSNGKEYNFLLKGHEDLRQDERVMQLFGLVNTLLVNTNETARRNLAIQRFAAIPLSQNSGLLSWVPHCDTLHSLIRDYRDKKKILLNIEHRIMLRMAPDYDHLTPMQKVEVFEHALNNTNGDDLARVLWLKSPTSEEWFERRTNFTRSLAVMSMVGYILGLGDRHPSNLMLHRLSGKILHIDFGDCFEVAMHREKFPERVPFRLTRMLVNAMEVTGIEGNYRTTCENVMSVLRKNKDSVLAVLEAFVYDPLFNWRLLQNTRQRNPLQRNNVAGGPPQAPQPVVASNVAQQLTVIPVGIQAPQPNQVSQDQMKQPVQAVPPPAGGVTIAGVYDNADATGAFVPAQQPVVTLNTMMPLAPVVLPLNVGADQYANNNIRLQQPLYRAPAPNQQQQLLFQQQQQALLMQQQQSQAAQLLLEQMNESVNKKALAILNRVRDKLTGRDFPKEFDGVCDVPAQVELLIKQATSNENLSRAYVGWCPFW